MAQVTLKGWWKKQAEIARKLIADKLRRGTGVYGRSLRPKKVSNRRRLGYGKGEGIPTYVLRSKISPTEEGFTIDFMDESKIGWFHRGAKKWNRPPRPIIGLHTDERNKLFKALQDEVVRQLNGGKP